MLPRADRVLPGIWRLRLPLPWPGVPHGNAYALKAGNGLVLVDTGIGGQGALQRLEHALAQAGFAVEDINLLVCTHAHVDHYGLAGPVVDAAHCELWMHPAWGHIRLLAEDPEASLERRLEVARQCGVPPEALERYKEARSGSDPGIDRLVPPDRDLVPGVEVVTDHGAWQVHETPGHAPSHVVLHQPESGTLLSGDHLLGRVSVFFDYGHTPDPVGEFLDSLDRVEELEIGLVLSGHGRPFRDAPAKIQANRDLIDDQLLRVVAALQERPRNAFDLLEDLLEAENVTPATAQWGLQITLAYLDHLKVLGRVASDDLGETRIWSAN